MRPRDALLAACAVLVPLVALAWYATTSGDAPDVEPARVGELASEAARAAAAPVALEVNVKTPAGAAQPVVEAARVAYSADNPLARGAIVLGALSARDGSPVLARSVHLDVWREQALVAGLDNETAGLYRAGPFEPGTYRVEVSSERFDALEFELVVPDDATTLVRDLVLTEPLVLVVHAETTAGEPLASALMRMPAFDYSYFLDVVPTTAPIELGAAISNAGVHVPEASAGKFTRDLRALDGSDVVGTLRVRALPVYVHLTWARTVLASVRADENAHEVTLVLDPVALAQRFGTLRMRVVDEESGLALPGVRVDVRQPLTTRVSTGTTDVNGVCLLTGVSPEKVVLELRSDDHCPWSRELEVAAASVTDAGIVALARRVTLDVRVVDAGGNPVAHELEVIELAELLEDHRAMQLTKIPVEVGLDVAHVPNLDRKRYVVRSPEQVIRRVATVPSAGHSIAVQLSDGSAAYGGENPFGNTRCVTPTIVDLATLERREIVLTARRASACTVQLGFEADPYTTVRIATAEGIVVGELFASGDSAFAVALLPGEYKLRVGGRERTPVERTLHVVEGPNTFQIP